MELKTSEELESSGYRCLFEYVKKEGVEPALRFFQSIKDFDHYCNKSTLLKYSVVFGENGLIKINRRNKDIVKYIREHKKDMKNLDLADESILTALYSLHENNALVDLYLENARRLEDLRVYDIEFTKSFDMDYYCGIYRNKEGQIIRIQKNYTDGKITEVYEEKVTGRLFNYSKIPYILDNKETTFSLNVENTDDGYSIRTIGITDFGFNGDKLPTEEEISSYDIPLQLIKK